MDATWTSAKSSEKALVRQKQLTEKEVYLQIFLNKLFETIVAGKNIMLVL